MSQTKITLLDGGMGQELIRRSGEPATPLWSTRVLLDRPELVEGLHLDFIKAGAKVITLNNYTATMDRLKRDATIDLFEPIHNEAKRVAQAARDKSGESDVKIAGSLPPLLASYKPELAPDVETCASRYRELVSVQKDGVDLFICETIATIREGVGAATAVREAGCSLFVSFTLDDDNPECLRSGEALLDAVAAVAPFEPDAILVNCSMPETVSAVMPKLVQAFPAVGAYANGFQSVAELDAGGTVEALKGRQDLTPEAYAGFVTRWADMGAAIVGGCCEVGPAHIAATAAALQDAGYAV